jgi:hypothetical protein
MKKIEFYSSVPGLVEACPIYEAKKYSAKWMNSAREDFIKKTKSVPTRVRHVYQCPGIFDLYNHGYIIPAWHDIIIKTNGDPSGFSWMVPEELTDLVADFDFVGKHTDGIDKYLPKKPGALTSVIKFNTPWNVIAPKGVKFLMMPLAYPDSFEFESSIGILDPSISNEINVQMYWYIKNGQHTVKAGTPLAHLIPLSEEKFELVCRDMTEWDHLWIKKKYFLNHFTFKTNKNKFKEFYYKHFGKN